MQAVIKIFILLILLQGCAHKNRFNSNACGRSVSRAAFYGGFYWLGGVIFQQGECALVRPLKIEFGEIYFHNKEQVKFAVESGGYGEIDGFAAELGCNKNSYELLQAELIRNKKEVFGESYGRSSRDVMLSIYNLIDSNEDLRSQCWK